MATGRFAAQVVAFAEKAGENADKVVRSIVLQIGTNVVLRSPVGNAELWAANAHARYGRETHNTFVEAINADIDSNAANFTRGGNLKRGVKRARPASARKLKKMFPNAAGKGYIGGRFRANWQVSETAPVSGMLDQTDPSGGDAVGRINALTAALKAGGLVYLVNNLPYGPRLEYEGWSKQAPAGMVRITMTEAQDYVNQALANLK